MHDIRPERVIALERENAELRVCIDKLFQQITELSAKYEAPADAVLTQQRALSDVPSHGMTNEMCLKLLTTKQLAALYAQYFFCLHGECPLGDLCEELDRAAPAGTVVECEDVIEHWLKTQQFKTIEQYLSALNINN